MCARFWRNKPDTDLMKERDDFLFTPSSAVLYERIEQNDPAMFAEIKQRVAEGCWEKPAPLPRAT